MNEKHDRIIDAYIDLVKKCNTAKTKYEHDKFDNQIEGFFVATKAIGFKGALIYEGDMHYINQGIDRPMIGGRFLDWEPQ